MIKRYVSVKDTSCTSNSVFARNETVFSRTMGKIAACIAYMLVCTVILCYKSSADLTESTVVDQCIAECLMPWTRVELLREQNRTEQNRTESSWCGQRRFEVLVRVVSPSPRALREIDLIDFARSRHIPHLTHCREEFTCRVCAVGGEGLISLVCWVQKHLESSHFCG